MKNWEIFLGLLKKFLHPGTKIVNTEDREDADWQEIIQMSVEHMVLPIVYEAVWREASFQRLPEEVRRAWHKQVKCLAAMQVRRTEIFLQIYKKLLDAGTEPLIVKGLVCRNMYRKPDLRTSSDEDMLIRREEFPVVSRVLEELGFEKDAGKDPLVDHEVGFVRKDGMHLEVHMSFFAEEPDVFGKWNREFEDVFERQIVQEICGVKIHTLDVTQHMLYLICHGLKHFMYCGLGIRQVCDMLTFAEAYGERIDWALLKERMKAQNMYVFWMNLFDIGERYLGFSWEKAGLEAPKDVSLDSQDMLEDILDAGIYGKRSSDRIYSANLTLHASRGGERTIAGVLASVFPSAEHMSRKYAYVRRHKWMLPVAWVQRIASYRKKQGVRTSVKAVQTGRQRTLLLRKYEVL